MNLYIIHEVLSDYTSGMVVIAAPTLDRCGELFREEFESSLLPSQMGEYDAAINGNDYIVVPLADGYPEGVVSYVWGGS